MPLLAIILGRNDPNQRRNDPSPTELPFPVLYPVVWFDPSDSEVAKAVVLKVSDFVKNSFLLMSLNLGGSLTGRGDRVLCILLCKTLASGCVCFGAWVARRGVIALGGPFGAGKLPVRMSNAGTAGTLDAVVGGVKGTCCPPLILVHVFINSA